MKDHWKNVSRACALLGLGLSLTACDWTTAADRASMRPAQLVDYNLQLSYLDTSTQQIITPGAAANAQNNVAPSAFSSRFLPVLDENTIAFVGNSRIKRDFVQDALMQRSDVLCENYLDGMYLRVTARKATLGEIAMVASSVGTFTGGEAAQALNLVSTLAQGTNSLVDSTVMQNQMVTLITNQIQANRTNIREQIMTARQKSVGNYSLALALRDAQSYHQTCSFLSGIGSLTATSNKPDTASANAASVATSGTKK